MRATSSYFDMSIGCSTLEFCLFPTMVRSVRAMTSWLPMNEILRSGNRPKPQQWKPDESTEVEESSAGEDQDWNDDCDADWTSDSENRSTLPGRSLCAMAASDVRVSSKRSTSETDFLVSDEEGDQTFECSKEELAGDTGLCGPVVDELILVNVSDLGRDLEQCHSEMSIAEFEEYERKTSEAYRKVFARARFPLPRVALSGVGDVCLVSCEHGERPCNELLLMRRWARGRADDHATLPADLEMRDVDLECH